ncbi:conserved hypothetical protein [Tolumonas auensis DSM 9187]|uniref:Hydrolase or metal-binding protein n=1 Tax=Tolumonas auensis (strain DSM 9187 / NBRC 110442 / TA 4) TaxID=595494 RepID=C4LDH0_TOLAT|nr:hypothetical protein [Tolumonas auensis]ACQ92766.1 conserved hypothetical protein [Tolumonas auensis DSM 9187]
MIKGLAITPPVIGRISIGRLVCKNDKWLPEKDDSFTLTTQVKNKGEWLLHPLHQKLVESAPNNKIRAIPVRMLFNDTDLNLRAEYSAFDRNTGRPLCVGNGESAKRVNEQGGTDEQACAGPQFCPFARQHGCKLYGRLNVQVDGQNDELGSFIFRTTGYNSVRTLAARLQYFHAISGGLTRYLPLLLRLRAKSTTLSYQTPVYYVDLTLREGIELASVIAQAKEAAGSDIEAGLVLEALEQTARQLLQNGQFEDSEEEIPLVMEEFYPEENPLDPSANQLEQPVSAQSATRRTATRPSRLTDKLGSVTQ